MKGIYKILLLFFFCHLANSSFAQGYIQDGKAFHVNMVVNNYHARFLNNPENQTKFISNIGQMGYNYSLSRLFNVNNQLGIGTIQNADNAEPFWTKSFALNYNLSVSMNLLKFFKRDYSAKTVLYGYTGYQVRYFNQVSTSRPNNILTAFMLGAGLSRKINDNHLIFVQSGVAQRLGSDFKTILQHQFGIMLEL